ncbi:type II secretion system F family protein [Arthrobacter sp. Sa2BUA2]|uniref:Type II secretion system F family protein n=1 Tax=Arthrobacter pullicola TaxID=2762224 RepID=A0ABR8YK24_9MICC|nr:type II secretion system F family protein [Arthrobacter pullicola]MBD8044541.1 type II secretion system F family protein [Arthrobacter pullicola]
MTGAVVAVLLGAAAWILCRPCSYPAAAQRGSLRSGVREKSAGSSGEAGAAGAASSEGGGISDPALMLDLVAAILVSGRPLPVALCILSESVDPHLARMLVSVVTALELGSDWPDAWALVRGSSPGALRKEAPQIGAAADTLRSALAFAASSGAPSAAVLHAQAEQIRRSRAREAERRAAALGIHLVLPLGLCALPAFICLTVVPLLLALLPSF